MRQPVPFGKYLLLDRISVGGMAEVFKAKSYGVEGFEKIIAIKRILPTMGEDRDFIKMFIDEAKIAGQLAHANICQIFELGRIDGSHFIAMEYIWGKDLLQIQNRVRKVKQQMPVPMACFVIAKVLEGLDYAHRKRDPLGRPLEIVHRDCSPQNVLVSYEGEVKVIDFGIAKATSRNSRTMAGVLKGKFGYMSPEQVRGLPLDRRSDIFALGTMLYECLTGERLFQGETDFSTLEKVRNVDIQNPRAINPNIPEAVERVILKALAKDVDDRYQWCSEMLADLQQYLMGQDVVFTAKSLSGWLKDVFTGEIDKERAQLETYKRVGRDGLIAGMPAAEAKLDVVEHLGEAGVPEGDATMLGTPSFDDLEQNLGVNAAPEMTSQPAQAAPSQRAKKKQDVDDGDFGEEAPTEIFGEIDNPPKAAAATTPPPLAAPPMAASPSSRMPTSAATPTSRPPKPPPGGARPTLGQPAMAAAPAHGGPGVMAGGALPAPMAAPMPMGGGAPMPNIANVPLVAAGPLGSVVPAGPATATRPAAMPLPNDVPAVGPSARTMGPSMVEAIGPSARTMGPPMQGGDFAQASPHGGYPVYGQQQQYYGQQQPTAASSAATMMAGGTPMAAGTPSQPMNAPMNAPGLAGGSSGKTMMGGMAAPSMNNNYGQQYRVSGQQAAASPYPSAAGYSGPYGAQPYASGQMQQAYGQQGFPPNAAGAVDPNGIPADGKKKSSIGRDVAIGIAIAALVLGGFLAVKFLILDSGSSGSGSASGSGAPSSIATIRLSLPAGISAELYVDDKKVATVSNGLEIPVTAGQRKVKLLGPGGAKCEETLNLAAGKTNPLECAMKAPGVPETPGTTGGSASGPGSNGASTSAPAGQIKTPDTKAPDAKTTETKAPDTKAVATTKAPDTSTVTTTTKAPETKAPETKTTKAPETKAPETKAPETKAPETKVATTKTPETKVPETKTKVPETKTKVPETKTSTKTTEPKVKTETRAAAETASDKGYLQVSSTPSAKIFVDGVDTGLSSPIGGKQLSLAPGKHKVTFAIGGDKFTFAVMIKAGQTEVLKKDLQ